MRGRFPFARFVPWEPSIPGGIKKEAVGAVEVESSDFAMDWNIEGQAEGHVVTICHCSKSTALEG